jgi:hypothetical protein
LGVAGSKEWNYGSIRLSGGKPAMSPSLTLFEVALFGIRSYRNPVFWGQSGAEQALELRDAARCFQAGRQVFQLGGGALLP